MTGLLLKGLGLFLLAAAISAVLTYAAPAKLLPVVRLAVWLLPLVFLAIELWSSEAAHEVDLKSIWRDTISAAAQTLLFWPGALAGHYAARYVRADLGGPRGNTVA